MSDTEVEGNVRRLLVALLDDIDMVRIDVEQGVVYLEGLARTPAQKQRIEGAVRRLPDVRRVISCLSLEHVAALGAGVVRPAFRSPLSYEGRLPPHVGDFAAS